ncbi:MAG: hypothetical protein KGS44_14445 [Alphaproteobacteria bacterium]|jgi:hypothetical protein|nr:hypothetical protein [Alphaproteobacteria bacterium]
MFQSVSRSFVLCLAGFGAVISVGSVALADDGQHGVVSEEPAFAYTIIEEDARIPFGADEIDSFRVGRDGSLLLRAGPGDWYRAVVWAPCQRDLRFEQHIGVGDRVNTGFDRFSTVVVDGNRCPIQSLDRIEDPRIAERAADAAAEAAG